MNAVPDPSRLPIGVDAELEHLLREDDAARLARYPGARPARQPAHTVYAPAPSVTGDLPARWSTHAVRLLERHAPDPAALAAATGLPEPSVAAVHAGLLRRLAERPVEDLRADLEDGYGVRPDPVEDADAVAAAGALAAVAAGDPAVGVGVRVKSLEPATRARAIRTLDLVVGALTRAGGVPGTFVVTLPKVTSAAQVRAFAVLCERLEEAHDLPERTLRFEVQVETPQAVLGADGTATVAAIVHAAPGRVTGLHYGTYDYSAALGVAGAWQSAAHPVADHAKAVMLLAAAGTGVWVSDGSTNVVPDGDDDRAGTHATWRLHAGLVRRALEGGLWQGWDLHPAHLVTRHLTRAVVLGEALPAAVGRLRRYLAAIDAAAESGEAAGAAGGVLDEPATARSLASLVLRAIDAGSAPADEVTAALGVGLPRLERVAASGA